MLPASFALLQEAVDIEGGPLDPPAGRPETDQESAARTVDGSETPKIENPGGIKRAEGGELGDAPAVEIPFDADATCAAILDSGELDHG